jgi:hypothetical protein
MKVKNQKTSIYKDGIQKENFTGEKPKMSYITGGKTLLTLYFILRVVFFKSCLNLRPCMYYALSLPIGLSSRVHIKSGFVSKFKFTILKILFPVILPR